MWKLEDAEAQARKSPGLIQIPPLEQRQNLQPGMFAELMFMAKESKGRERMWVEIKEVLAPGKYEGVLANAPVVIDAVEMGSLIKFGAKHVAAIEDTGALFHPSPMNYNMKGAFDAFEIWRSNEPKSESNIAEDDLWYYAASDEVKSRSSRSPSRPGSAEESRFERPESVRNWRPSRFGRPPEGLERSEGRE
jgi:hypothetical protein